MRSASSFAVVGAFAAVAWGCGGGDSSPTSRCDMCPGPFLASPPVTDGGGESAAADGASDGAADVPDVAIEEGDSQSLDVEASADASIVGDEADAGSPSEASSPDVLVNAAPQIACYREATGCSADGCDVECVRVCSVDNDCTPGHSCVTNQGLTLCSPYCDPTRCPLSPVPTDCNGPCGDCVPVACSARAQCTDPLSFCANAQDRCFPLTGVCDSDDTCPAFATAVQPPPNKGCGGAGQTSTYGQVSCVQGVCRFVAQPASLPDPPAVPPVVVREPTETTSYPDASSIVFEWNPTGTPVIILVLNQVPADFAHLLDAAVWGFAGSSESALGVHWDQGKSIVNGQWVDASAPVPADSVLYLIVQAVHDANLVAVSGLVPFVVGPRWPEAGDPCSDSPWARDGCDNPARTPQVCFDGLCWTACASDADCPPTVRCGEPIAKGGLLRLCGR
jgi:hypothetical protein